MTGGTTPDPDTLAQRLRAGENFYAESSLWYDRKLADAVDEAAARIDADAAEISRLRAEAKQHAAAVHSCHPACTMAGCVNERLRAEVAALRAAAVPALPFAVFDEFGKGADDRVQDYAAACVVAATTECSAAWQAKLDNFLAAERERIRRLAEAVRDANAAAQVDTDRLTYAPAVQHAWQALMAALDAAAISAGKA